MGLAGRVEQYSLLLAGLVSGVRLQLCQSSKTAGGTAVHSWSIGGSVVEFSPATREARVRFPANAAA